MAPFSDVKFSMLPDAPNPSVRGSSNVVLFSPYERKGVIIMAVAGITSCSLVSVLLLFIIFSALLLSRRKKPDSPTPFIKKQVAVFVVCLLASDFIQSIAGILQTKWAVENKIYEGAACTVQAAALIMGDLGSTIWSCVIAAHTFSGLALGKQWERWVVIVTVVLGWGLVILLTIIGPAVIQTSHDGPFFGIAGDWCFITSGYAISRLAIHYIPLFMAATIILVFYGLVILVLRGTISFLDRRIQLSPFRLDDVFLRDRVAIAKRMLWYPIAYLTCILPIAVIRLVGLKDDNIPDSVWIFGMFFLFSLGAVDSVIYATTRHVFKTVHFPVHLNTFSSDSSGRPESPRRKSQLSEAEPSSPLSRALDMTQYVKFHWNNSSAQKMGNKSPQREVQPGAVHVTLERIQEVM